MRMVCEKYKCEMDVKACLARQKKYDNNVAFNVVNRDPGCAKCAQGMEIKKQMKGKKMTDTAVKIDTPAAGKAAGMDVAAELDALEAAAKKRKTSDQSVDKHEMAPAAAKQKRCPKCGKDLPADLDHFYEDIRGRLNLSCWCKECQRARGRQRKKQQRLAKRAAAASDAVPAGDVPEVKPAERQPRPRLVVELDFTDHPKFLEQIRTAAKAHWRSVDQQIMAWVEKGLIRDAEWTLDDDNESPIQKWAKEILNV